MQQNTKGFSSVEIFNNIIDPLPRILEKHPDFEPVCMDVKVMERLGVS